jgi:hypothetical protein
MAELVADNRFGREHVLHARSEDVELLVLILRATFLWIVARLISFSIFLSSILSLYRGRKFFRVRKTLLVKRSYKMVYVPIFHRRC